MVSARLLSTLLLFFGSGLAQQVTPPPSPPMDDLYPHPVFDNPQPKYANSSCAQNDEMQTLGASLTSQYNYLSMSGSSSLANYCLVSRMNDVYQSLCGSNGTLSAAPPPPSMAVTSMIAVSDGKTTLDSACCGRCTAMFGDEVSLILFPSATMDSNGTNASMPTTVVSDGFTYSSQSAYVAVSTGYILDGCHTTQEAYFSTSSIVAIDKSDINSLITYVNSGQTTTLVQSYDQAAQLSDCKEHMKTADVSAMRTSLYTTVQTYSEPPTTYTTTYILNPCRPVILFPEEFFNVVGAGCYGQAMLDPPTILNPYAALKTPSPAPAQETKSTDPETTKAAPSMFNPIAPLETGALSDPPARATATLFSAPKDPKSKDASTHEAPAQTPLPHSQKPSESGSEHQDSQQTAQLAKPPSSRQKEDPVEFTIASQTFRLVASGSGVVVEGHTIAPSDPAVTVSGQQVTLDHSKFVVGTHTIKLDPSPSDAGPTEDPVAPQRSNSEVVQEPAVMTIEGNQYTAAPSRSEIHIDGQTIRPNAPAVTVNNQPVSLDNSQHPIIGSETHHLDSALVPAATSSPISQGSVPSPSSSNAVRPQIITVDGNTLSIALSGDGIVISEQTVHPKSPAITINNQPISVDENSHLIIGTQTHDIPTPAPATSTSASIQGNYILTLPSATLTIQSSGNFITLSDQTVSLDAAPTTLSNGQTVSYGANGLVINDQTYTPQPPPSQAILTLPEDTITIKSGASAVTIGDQIINSGAKATTLSDGKTVSLGSQGVVVGGNTYGVPSAAATTADGNNIGEQIIKGLGGAGGGVVSQKPGSSSSDTGDEASRKTSAASKTTPTATEVLTMSSEGASITGTAGATEISDVDEPTSASVGATTQDSVAGSLISRCGPLVYIAGGVGVWML